MQGDVDLYAQQRTPVAERARRLLAHAVAQGTRAVRANVDVAPAYGPAGVEGLAAARGAGRPGGGLPAARGGADARRGALLAEAAASGLVDAVGGIDPAGFDGVGAAGEGPDQLDQVFDLAERHGLLVDVHLHETGERGLAPLRDVAARTAGEPAECFALASAGDAALLWLPAADLAPGSPADFLLVGGECLPQVVVDLPRRDVVVRAGRVVARDGRFTG